MPEVTFQHLLNLTQVVERLTTQVEVLAERSIKQDIAMCAMAELLQRFLAFSQEELKRKTKEESEAIQEFIDRIAQDG